MTYGNVDNNEDVIDSRDVIARLEELREARDSQTEEDEADRLDFDEADAEELRVLEALEERASSAADWTYGETLIRDSYFEDYAQQLAEDCAGSREEADLIRNGGGSHWPFTHMRIDWEAAASDLQSDYFDVDFDGVTYWIR